jgi:hypothetical protein
MNRKDEIRSLSLVEDWVRSETRRQFLRRGANALGMAALSTLFAARPPSPPECLERRQVGGAAAAPQPFPGS